MTKRYYYDKTIPPGMASFSAPIHQVHYRQPTGSSKTIKNRSTRIASKLTHIKHLSVNHVSSLLGPKMAFLYVGIKSKEELPDLKESTEEEVLTCHRADEKAWVPQAKLMHMWRAILF